MLWVIDDLLRSSLLSNQTIIHEDDLVRYLSGKGDLVGHDDHCPAFVCQNLYKMVRKR